ncbi:hypothetical protein [Haladaptatus sp. NG-WS-4]
MPAVLHFDQPAIAFELLNPSPKTDRITLTFWDTREIPWELSADQRRRLSDSHAPRLVSFRVSDTVTSNERIRANI